MLRPDGPVPVAGVVGLGGVMGAGRGVGTRLGGGVVSAGLVVGFPRLSDGCTVVVRADEGASAVGDDECVAVSEVGGL